MTFIILWFWLMFGFVAASVFSKTNSDYGIKLGRIEQIFAYILYTFNGAIGLLMAMHYRKMIVELYGDRFIE